MFEILDMGIEDILIMEKKWETKSEYWYHSTSNNEFNLTEKTPSDRVLMLTAGQFSARLSWKGSASEGEWCFTTPIIFRNVVENGRPIDIEWNETGLSDLEDAKIHVEEQVAKALTLIRDEIDTAISTLVTRSYSRIVNGKEVTCQSTRSIP
jgi:hypothetical protein